MPKKSRLNFDERLCISPSSKPSRDLNPNPGDLSQFAPHGEAIYGYTERHDNNPFKGAPCSDPSGGILYFGCNINSADFTALLRLLEITTHQKDFAVYTEESEHPGRDGYILQMRIVSRFALRFLFGTLNEQEYSQLRPQKITIEEALLHFIDTEKERWGTSFYDDSMGLRGIFGGDGDFAREELAFGFMLENRYNTILRIWSRAWLVTK